MPRKNIKRPTIAETDLMLDWPKNSDGSFQTEEFDPFKITCGSGKKPLWCCRFCEHEWFATPEKRYCQGSGCPACINQSPHSRLKGIISDSSIKMSKRCGNRIRNRLSEYGYSTKNMWDLLGYSPYELAHHIESHFYNDMSWENYTDWDIDHVIPLCTFIEGLSKEERFQKLWSLENLRPLFRNDHIMKTEFEYLAETDEDYSKLHGILKDFYAKTPENRIGRGKYHFKRWPKKWVKEITKRLNSPSFN